MLADLRRPPARPPVRRRAPWGRGRRSSPAPARRSARRRARRRRRPRTSGACRSRWSPAPPRAGPGSARGSRSTSAPSWSFGAIVSAGACSTWAPRRSRAAIRSSERRSEVTPIRKPASGAIGLRRAGLGSGTSAVSDALRSATSAGSAPTVGGQRDATSPITTTAGERDPQPPHLAGQVADGGHRAALGVGEPALDHRRRRVGGEPGRGQPGHGLGQVGDPHQDHDRAAQPDQRLQLVRPPAAVCPEITVNGLADPAMGDRDPAGGRHRERAGDARARPGPAPRPRRRPASPRRHGRRRTDRRP